MKKHILLAGESGASLIEVLVAMAIFAVGALAIASLHYTTTGSIRSSNETTEAVLIAQNYLNQTLNLPYRDNSNPSGCSDCMKTKTGISEGKYTVDITVDPSIPPVGGTATITVSVTWPKGVGLSSGSYSIQYVRPETRNTTGI